MHPPRLILSVLDAFRPEFSKPTRPKAVTLTLGTLLARGRRTVAAALHQMGLHDDPHFSPYHQVFNRAAWSPRRVARRLLSAAVAAFVTAGAGLTFAIDETLQRRWGRKIRKRGHYRDPLASSQEKSVAASGIRWIVLALVVTPPWTKRPWVLTDPQPARPDPQGWRQAGATSQDHPRTGPPDDRPPPSLAAARRHSLEITVSAIQREPAWTP